MATAARLLAPMWPLEGFIAVNPLMDLLELDFEAAIREASRWLPVNGYPTPTVMKAAYATGRVTDAELADVLAERHLDAEKALPALHAWLEQPDTIPFLAPRTAGERADQHRGTDLSTVIDGQVAAFCAAFIDEGVSSWALPNREHGLYRCWRMVAACDPLLHNRLRRRARKEVGTLMADPEDAILVALRRLGVPEERQVDELRGQLSRLPGWASYARWRKDWAPPNCVSPPLDVLDLLAVRMSYEALLIDSAASGPSPLPEPAAPPNLWAGVWLDAYERHYRDELLRQLAQERGTRTTAQPHAQLVFCIDARSERLRRHLEGIGPYATFGFAGFFGFPVAIAGLGDRHATPRCPVLMSPHGVVRERPALGWARSAGRVLRRRTAAAAAGSAWHAAKVAPGAAFPLAEALGWWLWPAASVRTAWPQGSRCTTSRTVLDPADLGGLALPERILFAETALFTMGLTHDFAPVVVFCGHRGRTIANPHASALDCGACAGAPGGPSARVGAAALNDPAVRQALVQRGLRIPESTWFVAVEHDTTTDTVTILDRHLIPARHASALAKVAADLVEAGRRCATERAAELPGAPPAESGSRVVAHLKRRSADWAQVRPEWGLARNAAFVVGPRSLTTGVDLKGRVFLHSYDPRSDPDGLALETILTGPLIVAQWISAQYYFSSVEPDVFGAGDKTLHNPVGGVGVLCGDERDLRVGVPWQSVAVGDQLYHEPMRLLAVVQASTEVLDAVIARNSTLAQLFDGNWIKLVVGPDRDTGWWVRRARTWQARTVPAYYKGEEAQWLSRV